MRLFAVNVWNIFVLFLKLRAIQTTVPVFTDVGVPINVNEDTLVQTLLDTFTVTDPDGGVITVCTHTGDNGEFDLVQRTADATVFDLYLVAGAGLEHDTAASYTLVVTCEDSGAETTTENIQIDIVPNEPPTLTVPTTTISVDENEETLRLLYTITVTDTEGDAIACNIEQTSPVSTGVFGVWETSSVYNVYLLDDPNLMYSLVSLYEITLRCADNFGSSSTVLTVLVTPNEAPTFDNLPVSVNPTLDVSASTVGTSAFTVIASDTDSTSLTFSMTSYPLTPDLFTIDSVTGAITVSKDLTYAVDNAYYLTVTVSDSKATTTETLTIVLTNVNTAPIMNNLPDTVSFTEDTAQTTDIFVPSISDPDAGDTPVISFSVTPSVHTDLFYYNISDNVFRLASSEHFDYETCSTFVVTFTVSDGKAETGPYTLTITVINVNELCTFSANEYFVTMYETGSGGGSTDTGIVVTDEDAGDTYTLSFVASTESAYFDIDATTGWIEFAVNYDVDSTHPSAVNLTVQCTDAAKDTETANISVTIEDVNDNAPTFEETSYLINVYQTYDPGTLLFSLNATDIDSGVNDDIEYIWVPQDSGGNTYYHLSANGAISLTADPTSMTYGEVHSFAVTATDKGTPSLSGTTYVDLIYKEYTAETTTTATATTETSTYSTITSFWDEPGNIAIVAISALLGAILIGLAAYLLHSYCLRGKTCSGQNCCKRSPKQPKLKVKPKPDPNKTPFDFWHDDEVKPSSTKNFNYGDSRTGVIGGTTYPRPVPLN